MPCKWSDQYISLTLINPEWIRRSKNIVKVLPPTSENYAGTVDAFAIPHRKKYRWPSGYIAPRFTYAVTKIRWVRFPKTMQRWGFETTIIRYHNVFVPRMVGFNHGSHTWWLRFPDKENLQNMERTNKTGTFNYQPMLWKELFLRNTGNKRQIYHLGTVWNNDRRIDLGHWWTDGFPREYKYAPWPSRFSIQAKPRYYQIKKGPGLFSQGQLKRWIKRKRWTGIMPILTCPNRFPKINFLIVL